MSGHPLRKTVRTESPCAPVPKCAEMVSCGSLRLQGEGHDDFARFDDPIVFHHPVLAKIEQVGFAVLHEGIEVEHRADGHPDRPGGREDGPDEITKAEPHQREAA